MKMPETFLDVKEYIAFIRRMDVEKLVRELKKESPELVLGPTRAYYRGLKCMNDEELGREYYKLKKRARRV